MRIDYCPRFAHCATDVRDQSHTPTVRKSRALQQSYIRQESHLQRWDKSHKYDRHQKRFALALLRVPRTETIWSAESHLRRLKRSRVVSQEVGQKRVAIATVRTEVRQKRGPLATVSAESHIGGPKKPNHLIVFVSGLMSLFIEFLPCSIICNWIRCALDSQLFSISFCSQTLRSKVDYCVASATCVLLWKMYTASHKHTKDIRFLREPWVYSLNIIVCLPLIHFYPEDKMHTIEMRVLILSCVLQQWAEECNMEERLVDYHYLKHQWLDAEICACLISRHHVHT